MAETLPDCPWALDERGYAPLQAVVDAGPCRAPAGWRGFALHSAPLDKHGHELDGDFDPKGAGGCDHQDTPEWKAEHRGRKAAKMEPKETESVKTPAAPVAQMPVTATVGAPEVPFDPAKFLPAGNQSGSVAVILAVLAVVGGGAGWKFWNKLSQQKHDQRMKELELQADGQRKNEEREQKCEGRHLEATMKLGALEARMARAEEAATKASSSLPALDVDELDEKFATLSKRVTKIETAVKKKGTK